MREEMVKRKNKLWLVWERRINMQIIVTSDIKRNPSRIHPNLLQAQCGILY